MISPFEGPNPAIVMEALKRYEAALEDDRTPILTRTEMLHITAANPLGNAGLIGPNGPVLLVDISVDVLPDHIITTDEREQP